MRHIFPKRSVVMPPGVLSQLFLSVLRGKVVQGEDVERFESEFAHYMGVSYAISSLSGRSSLFALLKSMCLDPLDEVIMSAYTYKAIPDVVIQAGLVPVLVDIEEKTLGIDPESIKKKITKKSKIIVATHLFGQSCRIAEIKKIADEYDLFLVEDCAHSPGAQYDGKKLGSFGDAAFFSFGIAKPFNAFEGGMIITSHKEIAQQVREFVELFNYPSFSETLKRIVKAYFLSCVTNRWVYALTVYPFFSLLSLFNIDLYSMVRKGQEPLLPYLRRLLNIQAIIGRHMLNHLDLVNRERVKNAQVVIKKIDGEMTIPFLRENTYSLFFMLPLFFQGIEKERVAHKFLLQGVDTSLAFMSNCADLFNKKGHYPVTEKIERELVLIHIRHDYSKEEMQDLAEIIIRVKKDLCGVALKGRKGGDDQ